MMRYVIAIAALLLALPVAAAEQRPLGFTMGAGLEGFRLDISVMSQPVPGGVELTAANNGDPGYILVGCYCDRPGFTVSSFAYDLPADWRDDRIVFGFRLGRGETSRLFLPLPDPGKVAVYRAPIVVLDSERRVITRTETSVYDGALP